MGDLIANTPDLTAACERAQAGGVLPLDTEFVWSRTYHPLLGIVQMADASGDCRAVDCLCGLDPSPMGKALSDPATVKILHDARQDLELLHHWTGALPCNVFDTQLAAAFAGFPGHMGLQRLLEEAIDVGLPKTETCTDWTQRPLTAAQVDYALDDVRYLAELRAELLRRADGLGTRAWLEEERARYDDPALYAAVDPQDAWRRVKCGRVRLEGRGRAFLRALAAVREETAREWNLPKAWLSDDCSLADIAADAEAGRTGDMRTFRPRFRHRLRNNGQRETLAAFYAQALAAAAALPCGEWPEDPVPRYPAEVREAADEALAWLRVRAVEMHVDAGVIANRAQVLAFVDVPEDPANPLAAGWRFETVGREMAERFAVV